MEQQLLLFASEGASGNVLNTLGIDFVSLGIQIGAFLIFFAVIAKFVYPPVLSMLDKRDKELERATEATHAAQQLADRSKQETEKLLKQAKAEAAEIVATAKTEATGILDEIETKSKAQAERIVADAQATIDKNIIAARKSLHNEMIDLVTTATKKVATKAVDKTIDREIVAQALKETN